MSVLQEMDINTWYWWCKPRQSDWQSSWAIYNPSDKHWVSLGVKKVVFGAKNYLLGNYGNQKRHPSSPKYIKSVGPTQSGYSRVFLMFPTCVQESLGFSSSEWSDLDPSQSQSLTSRQEYWISCAPTGHQLLLCNLVQIWGIPFKFAWKRVK